MLNLGQIFMTIGASRDGKLQFSPIFVDTILLDNCLIKKQDAQERYEKTSLLLLT